MKILVTGDRGYIGAVLVPMLASAGYEVCGLDSDLYRNCTFGNTRMPWTTLRKDLRDLELSDLRGFEAVIHLAALSNDPLGNLQPELTAEINYRGTVRLAELAKRAGVQRFIFSSSCSTYGAAGDEFLTEEAAFNPVTPYAISKVKAEADIGRLADARFSPTFLRNATAYGASPRLRLDIVLNNLVASAVATKRIFVKSDGTPWRPIVHVEDICRAFLAALEAPRDAIHNRAFNVGRTEENYRIRELAEIVKEAVPGSVVEYAKGAGPDKRCYRVDFGLIQKALPKFQPKWDARAGARQLREAYEANGICEADLEGSKYNRIGQIEELLKSESVDESLRWQTATACAEM